MRTPVTLVLALVANLLIGQDTTLIQTLTFDSTGRVYTFTFPDGSEDYRQVLMRYRMRCKNAAVSTGSNPNLGCGEWDYSCNTFITDSTRTDSVKATHPNFTVSGFSGNTFEYTTQPTYTFYSFQQQSTMNSGVVSENVAAVGSGSIPQQHPFGSDHRTAKSLLLYSASELMAAGMVVGTDITGIELDISSVGSNVDFLKIKLKQTTQASLNDSSSIDDSGFTETFFQNTSFAGVGAHRFDFHTPFVWDGTSNVLVEVSFTNGASGTHSEASGTDVGAGMALRTATDDKFLRFPAGNNYVEFDSPLNFGANQDFSLELWVKPTQSQNDPAFLSDKNWNSGGNKGIVLFQNGSGWAVNIGDGDDRLDLAGGDILTDGLWHHLAVTCDRDGNMILYQDGQVENTGSLASIDDIFSGMTMKVAQDGTGSYGIDWVGDVDDLRIWNTVLTPAEIEGWRYRKVSASHPQITALVANHGFDQVSAGASSDGSGNGNDMTLRNSTTDVIFRGEKRFKHFLSSTQRPNMTFIQGVYTSTISTPMTVLDSLLNPPNTVTEFSVNGNDLLQIGTYQYYEAGDMPILNENGTQIGVVNYPVQSSLNIIDLDYYSKSPAKIEIMSFVTPYGIDLDLGSNGKMWEFDVTDFTTVLRDDKRLSVEFAGAYQEELDIQFLFIEGTPPRDVLDLKQVWRPGVRRGYVDLMNDRYFEPRTVALDPNASMFKLRTSITGHGQQGEFIPRTHYMNVNGGSNEVSWQVWTECADNPIYPQGGTWVYDRAGWCPGAPTDIEEYEIAPTMIVGNSVELDYGVTSGSGTSEYYVSYQLVSYGPANFTTDAAVIDVVQPTTSTEHMRFNPNCTYPMVTIQNTGSDVLTSLDIQYSVSGGPSMTYSWTGSLDFLDTEDIELPINDIGFWYGNGDDHFHVTVSSPNGSADQNADNNSYTSEYELADSYMENFVVELRTNNNGSENGYTIKDLQNNIVHSRLNLAANTTYLDTLALSWGCYVLELTDSGQDGLQWWANPSQGVGYIRLRPAQTPGLLKIFDSDFGSIMRYSFNVGNQLSVPELSNPALDVAIFPNPATDDIMVSINGNKEELAIQLLDALGNTLHTNSIVPQGGSKNSMVIDLEGLAIGTYFVRVSNHINTVVKPFVKE